MLHFGSAGVVFVDRLSQMQGRVALGGVEKQVRVVGGLHFFRVRFGPLPFNEPITRLIRLACLWRRVEIRIDTGKKYFWGSLGPTDMHLLCTIFIYTLRLQCCKGMSLYSL